MADSAAEYGSFTCRVHRWERMPAAACRRARDEPHDGSCIGQWILTLKFLRIDLVERVSVRMMQVQVEVVQRFAAASPWNAILHDEGRLVRSPLLRAESVPAIDTVQ